MKKIYFVMAVLATALLASCEKEQPFNEFTPLGENDIAYLTNIGPHPHDHLTRLDDG